MTVARHTTLLLLVLTSTVGVITAQDAPKQGVTKQKGGNTKGTKQADQNHEAADKESPPKVEQPSDQTSDTQRAKSNEDIELQRELVTFTICLAIVGALQFLALLVQAFVFWRTLGAVRTQADLMRVHASHLENVAMAANDNAAAAKISADAIITENRPWLLLDEVEVPYLIPTVEAAPGTERFTHCIVKTKNHGKTPAKVGTLWARLQIGENPMSPPKDLVVEIGRTSAIPEPYIFPPGEVKEAQATLSSGFISAQERVDIIKNKTKFLWLLGFIKYRNTFERESGAEYETRFCYLYETRLNSPKPFWTPAGPLEYNRAT